MVATGKGIDEVTVADALDYRGVSFALGLMPYAVQLFTTGHRWERYRSIPNSTSTSSGFGESAGHKVARTGQHGEAWRTFPAPTLRLTRCTAS